MATRTVNTPWQRSLTMLRKDYKTLQEIKNVYARVDATDSELRALNQLCIRVRNDADNVQYGIQQGYIKAKLTDYVLVEDAKQV